MYYRVRPKLICRAQINGLHRSERQSMTFDLLRVGLTGVGDGVGEEGGAGARGKPSRGGGGRGGRMS